MRRLLLAVALLVPGSGLFAQEPPRLEAEAKRAFDTGRFREASEKYARAAQVEGLSAERKADLLLQSAWSSYIAGNPKAARETLKAAFTARPDLSVPGDLYSPDFSRIAQSVHAEVAGASSGAVDLSDAKRSAREKLQQGNAEAAAADLQRLAASKDPEVHRLLAEAYDRLGRGAEADVERRRASDLERGLIASAAIAGPAAGAPGAAPSDVAPLLESAQNLLASGDAGGAEGLARRALEANPRSAEAHRLLGEVFLTQKKDSDAEKELTAAAALDPASARAQYGLAVVNERAGKWNTAASQYRRALELDGKSLAAALGLGRCMEEVGDETAARLAFGRAVEIDPVSPVARNDLGVSLFRSGTVERAAEELTEAVRLAPGNAVYHENLGRAYRRRAMAKEAERELAEASRLAPDELPLWMALGEVRMDLGKPAEAAAAYEGALRLDPGNEDAAAGLGAALAGTNRLAEAEEALRRASEAHPASARLWNDLGVVRVRRGQYPGALDAFRRALEVDPGFAAARRNLAGAEQLSALERAAS